MTEERAVLVIYVGGGDGEGALNAADYGEQRLVDCLCAGASPEEELSPEEREEGGLGFTYQHRCFVFPCEEARDMALAMARQSVEHALVDEQCKALDVWHIALTPVQYEGYCGHYPSSSSSESHESEDGDNDVVVLAGGKEADDDSEEDDDDAIAFAFDSDSDESESESDATEEDKDVKRKRKALVAMPKENGKKKKQKTSHLS